MKKKTLFTVFLDGLKPESLKHMPFVNSFIEKKQLRTILGYSITCHASMYSGVFPDKHRMLFIWKKNILNSPFKILKWIKIPSFMDNIYVRFLVWKVISRFINFPSFFGLPFVAHLPFKFWHNLDLSEKKFWDQDNYIDSYKTIFEIFREKKIDYKVIGMEKGLGDESFFVAKSEINKSFDWVYLFMGDVDHFSHSHTQESNYSIDRLKIIDKIIMEKYIEYKKIQPNTKFLLFSDHGHSVICEKINLYDKFQENGLELNSFFHVIDANFCRIWVNCEKDKQKIVNILNSIAGGWILSEEEQKKEHIYLDGNEFGDIIFYLDKGAVFSPTIWGAGSKVKSMHGYLPSHDDSYGVVATDLAIQSRELYLVDLGPTILDFFGLKFPYETDGSSFLN